MNYDKIGMFESERIKLKNKATGKSYAKIIWFGEHNVVYGKPAIAIPIYSVDVTATIEKIQNGQEIHCRYFDGPINEMADNLLGVKTLTNHLISLFGAQNIAFDLNIQSKLPAERGMGSSAATAIAIVRAFFDFFEVNLTRSQLLKLANIEEKITHGNPSGLDSATASSNMPIWFVKNEINEQIDFNLPTSSLVIADSGIEGKTSEAVSLVHDNVVDEPETAQPLINELGKIAESAREALATTDDELLGKLMNQSQHDLAELGVSNHTLDTFCQIACDNHALGAKLTGSGLGGCVIALAKNQTDAQQISTALRKAGATQTWIQSFKNYQFSTGEAHDNLVR
ncbi:mevalonate kinase [Lentilactobacillus kefiri]|uniref:mevalonate kinase n=1 Tax=Lentilactobacillus kefiri TaxID=33962 RepID=UPI0006F0B3DC|nr:mevalonate kinase [Lentilactobacillus kefiri]KRL62719.1 mevalonate kinase [Lentilactobacillus parakefiri DSM 10551]